MSIRRGVFGLVLGACAGCAWGQSYDFSQVTALGEGAILGQNVAAPVPGFELVLMRDGVVIYQRAFGAWSINRVAAADSSTKTLSGAVILSVVDSAPTDISLDTRLGELLPEYASSDERFVTMRQAFAHTSGMRGNSLALGSTTLTLRQAAAQIATMTVNTLPDAAFSYAGVSMHAAGAAAEVAGGAPWNTLFQQRIATPLGLSVTRYVLSSPTNPRIAGGAESNGVEFSRFMDMLLRGGLTRTGVRVLSEESASAMFTRQTPPNVPIAFTPVDSSSDYGVGVWLWERDQATGELRSALAAGARGFASWADFDDQLVGTFSTDTTSAQNVIGLLGLLRDAAADAVRRGACDSVDVNRDGVFPDDADLDAFIRLLGGASCATCGDIDFNNDGVFPDDEDLVALLRVLAGGNC